MEETKRIIEINGVKIEVDLRTATRIDEFKIGDNVKVLKKNGSDFKVLPGVIIDFVDFKELPTIQIATFEMDYWGNHLNFINFNSDTKDIEISGVSNHEIVLEKNRVIDKFNVEIEKKQSELDELLAKKNYLIKYFGKYFKDKPIV
jgi:hypothetical protein